MLILEARAWNLVGLGIRCAQALGMHLTNTTPNMSDGDKNLRLRTWFSILSLERTMTVITGRPSMVRDRDCSAVLRPGSSIDPDQHLQSRLPSIGSNQLDQVESTYGRAPSGHLSSQLQHSGTMIDTTFFFQYVELSSLADEALSMLYSAHIRNTKWSELQSTILQLDQKLSNWNRNLPEPFSTGYGRQKSQAFAVRVAIGMLFHSTRIIINRPCLCRLDRRITNQSKSSDSINAAAADRCVVSARAMLSLLPDQPEPAIIYQARCGGWHSTISNAPRQF